MRTDALHHLWGGLLAMPSSEETEDLLEQLQRAAEEQQRILERQAALINRLRAEMKDVKR